MRQSDQAVRLAAFRYLEERVRHQGPSRDLFVRYTRSPQDATVAYAIATGIIHRRDVPDELLEHLASALEFHARAPSEE